MLLRLKSLTLAGLTMLILGCGSNKAAPDPEPKVPSATETPNEPVAGPREPDQIINVGPALFDKFSVDRQNEKVWTVRWRSAKANLFEGGDFSGLMQTVDGSIYQEGREVSTFKADTGEAVQASETLTLSGNVTVIAKETGLKLTCQKIVYEAKNELIKASGNVRIEGEVGVISGVNELWTTPELSTVATPDLWEAR